LTQGRGDAATAIASGVAFALGGFHHSNWSYPMSHLEAGERVTKRLKCVPKWGSKRTLEKPQRARYKTSVRFNKKIDETWMANSGGISTRNPGRLVFHAKLQNPWFFRISFQLGSWTIFNHQVYRSNRIVISWHKRRLWFLVLHEASL